MELQEQLIDYVHKDRPPDTYASADADRVIQPVERKRAGWVVSIADAAWLGT
jgi:hypothetical protein